jgi:carbamoyl-phosphate synthase/aspartate carbamoyltransferase/dihydroorotase
LAEKDSEKPPPGFPGLETALGLYLQLVEEGVLTLDSLVEKTATNPRRIFGLDEQPATWIEVDPDADWVVRANDLHSRAGWTPFEGWKLRGKVRRVVLRGREAFRDGQVLAPPGFGRNVNSPKLQENEKLQEEMNL